MGSGVLPPKGALDATISLRGPVDGAAVLAADPGDAPPDLLASHLATLETHRDAADALADRTLHTSRVGRGPTRLAVVFRVDGEARTLVSNPKARRSRNVIVSEDEQDALALLACAPDAPRASALAARPADIVAATGRALQVWCTRHGVDPDTVTRAVAVSVVKGDPDAPAHVV